MVNAHTVNLAHMAIFFQLALECGDDYERALLTKRSFEGQTLTLTGARVLDLQIDDFSKDERGRWWVSVIFIFEQSCLTYSDERSLLVEAGQKAYEKLRSVHGYRFALVGFEVFQFNNIEALPELLIKRGMPGLVVSNELFQQLGEPECFEEFVKGYFWIPADYKFD